MSVQLNGQQLPQELVPLRRFLWDGLVVGYY
jgi:hypothetical protein